VLCLSKDPLQVREYLPSQRIVKLITFQLWYSKTLVIAVGKNPA
jgi:hypothetical protein